MKTYLPKGEKDLFLIGTVDHSKHEGTPDWFDGNNKQLLASDNVYTYTFSVGHQGVPVRDWSYTVRIDAVSGRLLGLTLPLVTDVKLPDDKNTVTPETGRKGIPRGRQAASALLLDELCRAGCAVWLPALRG